jgi:hypothetical protein
MTTSSVIYDHSQERVWPLEVKLAMMGLPASELQLVGLTKSEVNDLCGEGMFTANIATLVLAVFLCPNAPWQTPLQASARVASDSSFL